MKHTLTLLAALLLAPPAGLHAADTPKPTPVPGPARVELVIERQKLVFTPTDGVFVLSTFVQDAVSRPPENAQVLVGEKEPFKLRVFVDRSVVEVFVNGRQCLAVRVYPCRADAVGVSLRAQGREAALLSLDAWQMKSLYR